MRIFDGGQTLTSPRYVSHRGFPPLAPENSLPGFRYAGLLRQWAVETDVHVTKDGQLVCCHNESVEAMYHGEGLIREMTWGELSRLRLKTGNRLECFQEEELRMPLFSEYLELCRRYGCVPFIEMKTEDGERLIRAIRSAGFEDDEVVVSSSCLDWLKSARKAAPGLFLHHIFSDWESLFKLAALGNAGLSWKVDEPSLCPPELIEKAHGAGLKVCLRAADSLEAVRSMLDLGLDYLPTNRMHSLLP